MTVSQESRTLAEIAARAADEKKGINIIAIDVSDVMAIADAFVIVSATNDRQVRAIVEEIEDELTAAGHEPLRREGHRENLWVLLDYGGLVVHVQREAEREFYGLDRLYRDCPLIEVAGLPEPQRPGQWEETVDTRSVRSIDEIPLVATQLGEDEL